MEDKASIGKNPLATGEKNDNPNLNKAADEVRETQKKVNERVEEINKDNPNPEMDPSKDDLNLFNSITDSIIAVYEDPQTAKLFSSMANKLGVDITEELVKLISTTVSYAIFGAIGSYGDWLNGALQKDFNTIDELVSTIDSNLATNIMKTLRIEKELITKGIITPVTEAPTTAHEEDYKDDSEIPSDAGGNSKYVTYPTAYGWVVKRRSDNKKVGEFATEPEAMEWINVHNEE